MQNLRERTARQIADTKQFAVQGVVKSFIEVADNLDLAIGSVPEKELEGGEDVDVERALTLLKRLRDGVVMTESIMLKLLEKEGVRKYDPQGEPFDPNLHNAMFRVPNSGVKSGHVAHVIKNQTIRPRPQATANPQPLRRSTAAPQPSVELAYSTGWSGASLHGSIAGQEWQTLGLKPVVSGAGAWHHLNLPVPAQGNPPTPLLEFVMTNGASGWDKPTEGGHYTIAAPGRYCLQHGRVESVAHSRRLLLVTDLDDTLVGDDEATAAFRDWWLARAMPAGARLVYNTGRALGLFEDLLCAKRGLLPEPDLLLSAAVRDAAYAALAAVGRDAMHFRPPAEQNEHKVTCGVHVGALARVAQDVRERLARHGVQLRLVASGVGDWRFLDLVPMAAGKRQAMDFAAETLGFRHEDIVAAGDSGNDVDMLEGAPAAIVVANAQPDLLEWVERSRSPGVIRTRGSRAWGILEGLERLGCGFQPPTL
ncbi:Protein GrpE [Auxenochlorella protothecoides]|uniref:Protein GrpE n=1 Tax=Auxenochlorella protothecoides TaxID=3075 RepID=A0A087SHZ9_AUXPR|nr:Protein GrpE [Auxenochlorella protothecoides]KFM25353.1 Protein GrpE [Auxenochlorella protothecoides]